MAIGYVTGEVERVLTGSFGVGLVIVEAYTTKAGEVKSSRYTAWFDEDPRTDVGATVTVSGSLSAKVDSWTTKDGEERTTAKISLNKARIQETRFQKAATIPDDADLPF